MLESNNLSICIPTRRDINTSKASIISALGFCNVAVSKLVLSDNSNDVEKENYWGSLELNNYKYRKSSEDYVFSNWLNGIYNCDTKFAGILSDDDVIINLEKSDVDYNEIDYPVIAIKPNISLWTPEKGIYKENTFNIDADTALGRVKQYCDGAKGDNTTLFSFYRRELLQDILSLLQFHPTKADYADWALVLAAVSSGKIYYDPTKMIIYKNERWTGSRKKVIKNLKELYERHRLSDRGYLFLDIFTAIDSFILMMRRNSPIRRDELLIASDFITKVFEQKMLKNLKTFENEINQKEKDLVLKIINESNLEKKLFYYLDFIKFFCPQFVKGYKNFYAKSLGKDWGVLS